MFVLSVFLFTREYSIHTDFDGPLVLASPHITNQLIMIELNYRIILSLSLSPD